MQPVTGKALGKCFYINPNCVVYYECVLSLHCFVK